MAMWHRSYPIERPLGGGPGRVLAALHASGFIQAEAAWQLRRQVWRFRAWSGGRTGECSPAEIRTHADAVAMAGALAAVWKTGEVPPGFDVLEVGS